jgi:hypothetical protein
VLARLAADPQEANDDLSRYATSKK